MKVSTATLLLASSGLFSACSYIPIDKAVARPVSQDYAAGGQLDKATAYVYGGRTVFELNTNSLGVFVKDETGADVTFEKVGHYYRLNRVLANFTVWSNGNSVTFAATTKPPAASIALQMKPSSPSDTELLKLATKQLAQVRSELELTRKNKNSNSSDLSAINTRLDEIETNVLAAAKNIVNVSFPLNSTVFSPNEVTGKALIDSAKIAERINVRGRTDSQIPGPIDAKIALGRALSARSYLVENGIESNKINVFSKAFGAFAVANDSKEGKAINRRVEIEFMNAPVAKLHSHTVMLAAVDKSAH